MFLTCSLHILYIDPFLYLKVGKLLRSKLTLLVTWWSYEAVIQWLKKDLKLVLSRVFCFRRNSRNNTIFNFLFSKRNAACWYFSKTFPNLSFSQIIIFLLLSLISICRFVIFKLSVAVKQYNERNSDYKQVLLWSWFSPFLRNLSR